MVPSCLEPGIIINEISVATYTVDIPENKNIIYLVKLLKYCYKKPEYINLILEKGFEVIKMHVNIPYPSVDPSSYLVSENTQEKKISRDHLDNLRKFLVMNYSVFSLSLSLKQPSL